MSTTEEREGAGRRPESKDFPPEDFADVLNTLHWVMVLASPPRYQSMRRVADPEHLVRLLDILIAYVDRDARYLQAEFEPVPYAQRGRLARDLRASIAGWTPPDLPPEMTEIARELLHAEGLSAPEGGWDALSVARPEPVEDLLLWPEGIPALLRATQA